MWRKYLAAVFLPVLAILVFAGPSLAAANGTSPALTVPMQGQGSVVGNEDQPQLRLKLTSTDSSGWLLEIAVNPAPGSSVSVLGLNGTFVLGPPGDPLSKGAAVGTIAQSGQGELKLTGSNGSTSLDVPFTIASNGTVTTDVTGQWPALPVPQTVSPQSSQAAATQPNNHFFWYLSRTAALVCFISLFLSICLALLFKSGRSEWGGGHWRVLDLHKFLAMLGIAFLGLHIFSLLGDAYFSYSLGQLLVPMASPYRALPVAMGVLAFYASVIGLIIWRTKKFIGSRAWRVFHAGATIVFLLALVHAITSGTDTGLLGVQILYVATGGIAVYAGLQQLTRALRRKSVAGAQ